MPPWRKPARRAAPGRQPLSQELIVATALRVLAEEGLDAVSMRRVAQELETGPASLYAHVADKDELLELMLDRVMANVVIPVVDPARWQEQLKELARDGRRVLTTHRDIARVAQASIPHGENGLRTAEGMLAILRAGRVPDQIAAWAVDILSLFITADAVEGAVHAERSDEELALPKPEYIDQVRDYFTALPVDRFPNVVALAVPLTTGGADERFEFGLELFIRGLAAYVPASEVSSPPAG